MSLIKFDPFMELDNQIERVRSLQNSFVPKIDIYEENNNVIVETPLVGIKPEDVEISIENRVLTIKGQTEKHHEVEEKNYYRKEVRSGSFHRQISLPVAVKEDETVAEYKNGLLKIICPKAEGESKKIKVKIK